MTPGDPAERSIHVGSILHAYTGGAATVRAHGATVAELLKDLDRRFPGIRFRVLDEQGALRPHVRVYVGERAVRDPGTAVPRGVEVHVLGALSGG